MAGCGLPRQSTDAQPSGASGAARTVRHPCQYWAPQSCPRPIGYWESRWALEKKQQTPCSLQEAQWQEGAGALLLVAAAQETGLLETPEHVLLACASHSTSRLAHLSSTSRQSLLRTLLFLGVVGLSRNWDLRSYTGDALGLLTDRSRAYGYWQIERFLSQMAQAHGADICTDALAEWTTRLWQLSAPKETDQSAIFYVDGHRKPVYTDALIPRGLVGRLSAILGCRALVLLHDAQGHPLLATTHRGDQHLTIGLPAIVKRYEQGTGTSTVQQIIVDREGMAAEFLAHLLKGHCWETLLSCSVEPLESRDACGSELIPIEPGHHTYHINRSGNPKMLQVRFGKADITGAAHAKGTHPPPKSSLRSPLAEHTGWQMRASAADDGRLGALHVGPAVGS